MKGAFLLALCGVRGVRLPTTVPAVGGLGCKGRRRRCIRWSGQWPAQAVGQPWLMSLPLSLPIVVSLLFPNPRRLLCPFFRPIPTSVLNPSPLPTHPPHRTSISAWPQAVYATATATGRRRCHPTGTPCLFQRPRRSRRRRRQGGRRRRAAAGRTPRRVAHPRRRPPSRRLARR